jgi:hypothetical protein
LIDYIRGIAAISDPVAESILVQSKIAHGNSFYRAILAPEAAQPGLLQRGQASARQAHIAALTQQIAALTQQLEAASGAQTAAAVTKQIGAQRNR